MATTESIQKAYIDYVLTEGQQPKSVYVFAKKNKMPEEEFYRFFGSFDAVEQSVWADLTDKTLTEIRGQEIWRSIHRARKPCRSSTAFLSY
jgi:hypothetical protein